MSGKRKAALGFIFVTLLIDVMGFGVIIPILPQLIGGMVHGGNGTSALYGGLLMFAFAGMQFLFSPVIGNLSDQYGRRPVLLFSLMGFCIDYLILALAPTIGWLFVGRILAGITGASFTTASAYIADISTPEKRAQNFGMIGVAFGVGFILGPLIGGYVGYFFGTRAPFYFSAGLTFLNMVYGYFILPESLDKEHRRKFDWKRANPAGALKSLKRYPALSGFMICLFCLFVAGHATQSTWIYFTAERFHWGPNMIGLSLGLVGLLVAIVQGGLVRVINPWLGVKKSIVYGLLIYMLGNILFAFANREWMMFVFMIPYCLGGFANPAMQAATANQVPANEQGELQGAITSLQSLSSIAGPLLMTNLFYFFTNKTPGSVYFPGVPFLAASVLIVAGLFFVRKGFTKLGASNPEFAAEQTVTEEIVAAE